jgi:PAS domain S-box-containing protein
MQSRNRYSVTELLAPKSNEELEQEILKLEQELTELKSPVQSFAPHTVSTHRIDSADDSASLRNFIDYNAIGVQHASYDGTIQEANDAFLKIIGYTREEFAQGKVRWTELTPKEFLYLDDLAIKQLRTTGKADAYEKQYIHKDGHRVPVLLAISCVTSDIIDNLVFVVDLTLQKQAEEALKVSEQQFRQLSNLVPQIIWISDAKRKTTYANDRFYQFTGLTPGLHDGMRWKTIIHPDDLERFTDDWQRSATFPNAYEIEVRIRQTDGQYSWHIARALPVTNAQKEVLMWFGTLTDIHQQKAAEEELKESETQFRTLADAIPQIVWTAEPDGQIDFFNHRWSEYTQLTLDQSLNNGWNLLIHPSDRKSYMSEWHKAVTTGDTYEHEFRLKRALGIRANRSNPYRWYLARAVCLRGDNGEIKKWFGTWTEIDEQKRKH